MSFENIPRRWEGKDWENFSLRLVQKRHGPENVQPVPDRVRGDAGLEFFTSCGCCYQSYAPQEVSDTAKASSAMKNKGSRDLGKLKKNEDKIKELLSGLLIRRWIMICPFLDDKSVISHIGKKAGEVHGSGVSFLATEFRGLVQCPLAFQSEIQNLRQENVGAVLAEPLIDASTLDAAVNQISSKLDEKLERGFPTFSEEKRRAQKLAFVKATLRSENVLEQMRVEMPDLWERAMRTILLEEERLVTGASSGSGPGAQLSDERAALRDALQSTLPSIEPTSITAIAHGQIGQWLIECPLDFEGV